MKIDVAHQDKYSRGQLLLRTIFGALYIGIPHGCVLLFVGIWSGILSFVTFWAILFTGNFPEGIFAFQSKLMSWQLRLAASMSNLVGSSHKSVHNFG